MKPANSLSLVFADIVLIPSFPKGEIERQRLQSLGYHYLCVPRSGFDPSPGRTAYAKPMPAYAEFVEYYEMFGGCYFQLIGFDDLMVIWCKGDQIISQRRVAEIEPVRDLGISTTLDCSPVVEKQVCSSVTATLTPAVKRKPASPRPTAAGAVKKLDDFTRGVLAAATAEGNVLRLSSQLSPDEYDRINGILQKMGGRWNRGKGGHVFPFPVADLLAEAVSSSSFIDRKQNLQLFETPVERCTTMVERLGVQPGELALEPSAGTGRLVAELVKRGAKVTAVELDPTNAESLHGKCEELHVGDFMTFAGRCTKRFHVIAMNPPFTRGQDMEHVQAAFELLRPGGRLVAIVSGGIFQKDGGQPGRFKDWLNSIGAEIEAIPPGEFAESGTPVATSMVVIRAPDSMKKRVPVYDYGPLFASLQPA
jgi:predicted RNA methylase